jgi:mono/diheme cytochrome c family protein
MMEKLLQSILDKVLPKWSPLMFKATLITLVAAAFVIPLALAATPFIEFFNGMAAQPKGKAQMTYGRTYDEARLVTRDPVEGTMPRGWQPYPLAYLTERIEEAKAVDPEMDPILISEMEMEAARQAGELLANPVPLTEEALLRGKNRFDIFCIVCHGPKGQGDGPATGTNPVTQVPRFPAPPSLHTEQAQGYKDGTIYHIVTQGISKMPGYSDKLTEEDRWKVIHYVRALQRAMNPRPEDLEP